MKKKWKWFAVILAVTLCFLAGCSKSADGSDASAGDSPSRAETGTADENSGSNGEMSQASDSASADDGNAVLSQDGGGAAQMASDPNRKLVKTRTLQMETTEFDSLNDWIREQVGAAGGYTESASVSGKEAGASFRHAGYVLRIPVSGLDGFLEELRNEGNVLYYTESVEDVTLNYTDTESHIAALEQEQETLMNMLAQSGDLNSLLAIQNRLTEVRYQLENYGSQLRIYDNQIEYGTIYLDITEVERETESGSGSFFGRLSEKLSSNFYSLGKGLQEFALWFLGALPVWIVLAVLALAGYGIYRKARRKRRRGCQKDGGQGRDTEINQS